MVPTHEKGRCAIIKTLKITLPSKEPKGSICRRLTISRGSSSTREGLK